MFLERPKIAQRTFESSYLTKKKKKEVCDAPNDLASQFHFTVRKLRHRLIKAFAQGLQGLLDKVRSVAQIS